MMRRIRDLFLLLLAGGSVFIILALTGMMFVAVYWQWQSGKMVASYAHGVIAVDRDHRGAFVDALRQFAAENGYERRSGVPELDRSRLFIDLLKDGVNITIENGRDVSEFDVNFFAKPGGIEDSQFPDRFFSSMKQRLGDAAVRP